MKTALVYGAGGFIGSHMVKRLKSEGFWVRGVDLKYPEFSKTEADEFIIDDLCFAPRLEPTLNIYNQGYSFQKPPFEEPRQFDEIYQFAADMGGAGYIFTGDHDADIMRNSSLININLCYALTNQQFKGKVFYSSSACMYPQGLQDGSDRVKGMEYYPQFGFNPSLKESDAYPANPDSEYGWEKLFSERLYLAYARNHNIDVRIARFHNIYGPEGTYKGGKEKAPAAMCRKAIEAFDSIEIWGDGKQTRSFLYIEDCIDAVRRLMDSDFKEPINIGSEEMVSIDQLADIAIRLTGKPITKTYDTTKPQGVRGRNSDNTLIKKVLGWQPEYRLHDGMMRTFSWIKSQMQ